MSTLNENQMVSVALKLGYINPQQISECKNLQLQEKENSIIRVLVKSGYLSREQVDLLCKQKYTIIQEAATNIADTCARPKPKPADIVPDFTRYKIVRELGRGGMGKVYEVYDSSLNRTIALKVLLTGGSSSLDVARFEREAKATASLQHPNIVMVYDIGVEQNQPYFTMDLIPGISLSQRLKENPMPMKQIANIMIKVASGIEHAHQQRIIHRDLKPANIMLDQNNEPKIMDFGLAKIENASQKLSRTGTMMGTLQYMPPEQVEGRSKAIDERSDIYGLGAILYEMLTGKAPYAAGSYANLINMIINKPVTPPSKIRTRVDKELEKICLKALQKDKEMRYQSAQALIKDLTAFIQGKKIKRSRGEKKLHLAKMIKKYQSAFMVVSILIVGILAFSLGKSSTDTQPKNSSVQNLGVKTKDKVDHIDSAKKVVLNNEENNKVDRESNQTKEIKSDGPFDGVVWNACWNSKDELFDFSVSEWTSLPHEKQFEYSRLYQKWYAQKYNYPLQKTLDSQLKIELILIPPGKIISKVRGQKQDFVEIHKPFYIGKYEITQKQWVSITKVNYSRFRGEDLPSEFMNWREADQFCKIIRARLPKAAEWVYACRAGSTTKFNIGNDITTEQVNFSKTKTTPVGSFPYENAWGGFDFHGNVSEWCEDWIIGNKNDLYKIFYEGGLAKSEKNGSDHSGIAGTEYRHTFLGIRIISE